MTITELKELTNDKGRQFINESLVRRGIEYAYFPEEKSNWFYVLTDGNFAVSMPYADSGGADASFFGDKQYLENHLKKKYNVFYPQLISKLQERFKQSEYEYQIEQFNIELADYLKKGDADFLRVMQMIAAKIYRIFSKDYLNNELNTLFTVCLFEVEKLFQKAGIEGMELFMTYFLEAYSLFVHKPKYGGFATSYPELRYKLLNLTI